MKFESKRPKLNLKTKKQEDSDDGGSYFISNRDVEFLSSGCTTLDCVLGGGWAFGRINNIVGDRSTGKTLVSIEACCNLVNLFPSRGVIRFVEPEAAFDTSYAAALGLPVERISFSSPQEINTVEDLATDLDKFIDSLGTDEPGLYILDSLDALSSKAELERKITDASYGDGKAKKMSEMFRRLNKRIKGKRMILQIISQTRDNIGVTFGEKHTRSGGKALDFYASQILWLSQTGVIKQVRNKVERVVGVSIRARCKKSKVGLPYRECAFDIKFGFGIDDIAANIKYLAAVGKLGMLQAGLGPDAVNRFIAVIEGQNPDAIKVWQHKINTTVKQAWGIVEQSFLPTRKKYG